jgi:2'-5' RNA ligase
MRAFLAIVPDTSTSHKLASVLTELACEPSHQLRLVKLNHLHLTLHFFDNLQIAHIQPLLAALQNIMNNFDSIPIHLTRKLLLPSNRHAKSLAYQIKASKALIQLKMMLNAITLNYGYTIEHEKFLPHITMARSKNSELLQQIELPILNGVFQAREIVLFESLPEQGEYQYKVIEIISFK